MTGRTHDLAAVTALNYIFVTQPLHEISFATVFVAVGANLIGGLAPDLDQVTSDLWQRLPAGSIIGRLIAPVLGSHRYISHSIIGILLTGFVLRHLLAAMHTVLLVDMNIVWSAFMIGYLSHLVTDMLTKDGVPWFFPIPLRIGIPPLRFLRIKTGGVIEKSFVFPTLMIANGYMMYSYYGKYLDFLRHYIR